MNEIFLEMLKYTRDVLQKTKANDVLVNCIRTAKGEVYTFTYRMMGDDDMKNAIEKITETLIQKSDTVVEYALCIGSCGKLDIPPYSFRQKLCSLNEENKNTMLLLQGEEDYLIKPNSKTLS